MTTMQEVLNQLKIKAEVIDYKDNGTMSRYTLKMNPGARVSKLESCATEIALGIRSFGKPIIKTITEDGVVTLEFITRQIDTVLLNDIVAKNINNNHIIPIALGKTYDGIDLIADLAKMPHTLIAGSTGSGKSVILHSIITSIILSNKNIKLVLIDPKSVELSVYNDIKQLMYQVITDPQDALDVLSDLVDEMNDRFKRFVKYNVNNLEDYNKKSRSNTPYIVIIIDEFSDIIHQMKNEFQKPLCMLAQKARACGMHIVIATQQPSVDVITGTIKANFPARISCRTTSLINSRVILDESGAEKLLGKGDAIIKSSTHDMVRFKGAFISIDEIDEICKVNKRNKLNKIISFISDLVNT